MQQSENKEALKALVVEGDTATRRLLSEALSARGFEVSACESPQQAREHYRTQSLVVAGGGSNGDVQRLVDFIRRSSGARQPYIITMAAEGGEASFPGPGVNDLLVVPIDERALGVKIGAASAWLAGRVLEEYELDLEAGAGKAPPEAPASPETAFEAEGGDPPAETGSLEGEEESSAETVLEQESVEQVERANDDEPAFEEEQDSGGDPEIIADPKMEEESPEPFRRPVVKAAIGSTTRFHLVQLVENGPLPMAMFDKAMHYVAANSRWISAYGLENDEVIGTSHFEFFSEVSQLWQDLCAKCMESEREQAGEESVVWADGTRERVHWIMRPWHYEAHEVGGLVVSYYPLPASTVTGAAPLSVSAEEESEFATDFAAALAQSQTAPVLVLDLHGRIMRSNRLARKLGRWSQTHGDERYYWQVFLGRDDRVRSEQSFIDFACDVAEHGAFAFAPTTADSVPCSDGTLRRIVWHNLPRHGADGCINGMIRVGVDMEELSGAGLVAEGEPRAERTVPPVAAKQSAVREAPTFDDWLHGLPGLHWKARRDGKVIFFNRAWLEFRGRRVEEEIDNGWMDGLHDDDHKRLVDAFLDIAEAGGRMNQLARIQDRSGHPRWLRFIVSPGRYGNTEEGDTFVGYCEDMTAQKHLEEELAKLQESVEESGNRNRSELEKVSSELHAAIEGARSERDGLRDEKAALEEELAALRAKHDTLQSEYDAILGESARAVEKLHFHEERATKLELNLKDARHEVVRMHEVAAKITDERNRFATIPDNAPFGILVFGSDGKLRYANPAHASVAGSLIDADEGMEAWLRRVCPDDSDEAREALVASWKESVWRGQRTTVLSVTGDDDSLRDLEFRPRMMKDGQFLVSIFDVSDRQRDENRVRANEAKFRALFHDSGVGMALIDRSGAIVDLNAALESLVGRNRSEVLKGGIEGLIVEADHGKRDALLNELRDSQARSGNVDLRIVGARGKDLTVQMNVSLIKDVRGEVLYTAYFLHPFPDFPERETTAAVAGPEPLPAESSRSELDEVTRMRALAFSGIHDGVVVADLKGRIIEWNKGAARIFGYEQAEILGKGLYVLYEREDPKRFRDKITRGIGGQRKWEEVTPIFRKDGSEGLCEVLYVPLIGDDGTPVALVGVNRELSHPRPAASSSDAGAAGTGIADERLVRALGCHLETIADLLDLQACVLNEPAARRAVVAGQNRVRALTLLQSCVTGNAGDVDFGGYVKALVQHLLEEVGPEHAVIEVHLNVRNIAIPLEIAAPLALCLNELLTNAFSHAFTGRSTGVVSVNMALSDDGGWMVVKDDGIGLPGSVDLQNPAALGLRVTSDLAQKLGGGLRRGQGPGTEIQIGFRANPD